MGNNVSYVDFAATNNKQAARPLSEIVEQYWLSDFDGEKFLETEYARSDFAPEGKGRINRESAQLRKLEKARQREQNRLMIIAEERERDTQPRSRVDVPNYAQPDNTRDVDQKIRDWAIKVKSLHWSRAKLKSNLERPQAFPTCGCPWLVPHIDEIMKAAAP